MLLHSLLLAAGVAAAPSTIWQAEVEVRADGAILASRTLRLKANEPSVMEVSTGGGDDAERVEVRLDTRDDRQMSLTMRYFVTTKAGWALRAQTAFAWSAEDDPPASAVLTAPAGSGLPAVDVRLSLRRLR